ncbi:MAG TPA: hypothetical protein VFT69_01935 [Pseudolabrys sp.]|nr:hypothetical protein [Pseudolabrys sp.]
MPAIASFATRFRPLVLLGFLLALLTTITGGLWTFYGTTVFFEIVRTGWVACF